MVVNIMAVGHLVHVEIRTTDRVPVKRETIPFCELVRVLNQIPPQPDRPINRIPK